MPMNYRSRYIQLQLQSGQIGPGAIEAIFSILAIRDQVAPPTINLDNPAVETAVDLAPNAPVKREINVALSNSFGFGGTNASVLFGKVD